MNKTKLLGLIACIAIASSSIFYACTKDKSESAPLLTPFDIRAGTRPTLVSTNTYYSAISQTQQVKLLVNLMSDGTYDVYATNQPITIGMTVNGYFPACTGMIDPLANECVVNLPAGSYTFIKAQSPSEPWVLNSPPGGSTIRVTCKCCGGSGNCTITGILWPVLLLQCTPKDCPSPGDGTVTCGMVTNSSNPIGGGVLIAASSDKIRIHN